MASWASAGIALEAFKSFLAESPDRARLRDSVLATHADLRQRELHKLAEFAEFGRQR